MRSDRLALLAWVLVLTSCDRPTSPQVAPPAKLPTLKDKHSLPPAGVLRLSPAPLPSDLGDTFRPTAGLPTLCVKLEYAGPKTRLEVDTEGWHQGKKLGGSLGHQSIQLPLSEAATFGFGEGVNPEGKPIVTVIESIPTGTGRTGGIYQYAVPPIKGGVSTFIPRIPLEVADGGEAIFWAVFVGEPFLVVDRSPETRARSAETAWLFKIRIADEKK